MEILAGNILENDIRQMAGAMVETDKVKARYNYIFGLSCCASCNGHNIVTVI